MKHNRVANEQSPSAKSDTKNVWDVLKNVPPPKEPEEAAAEAVHRIWEKVRRSRANGDKRTLDA